jgi:hypothetical protein
VTSSKLAAHSFPRSVCQNACEGRYFSPVPRKMRARSGMYTRALGKPPAMVCTKRRFSAPSTSGASVVAKASALRSNRRAPASRERTIASQSREKCCHASGFTLFS